MWSLFSYLQIDHLSKKQVVASDEGPNIGAGGSALWKCVELSSSILTTFAKAFPTTAFIHIIYKDLLAEPHDAHLLLRRVVVRVIDSFLPSCLSPRTLPASWQATQLLDPSLDALIQGGEAVAVDQVLPDRHRHCAHARGPRRSVPGTTRTRSPTDVDPARGSGGITFAPADAAPKWVVTSLAGLAGARRPHPPDGRTAMPAALKYAAAFSDGCT